MSATNLVAFFRTLLLLPDWLQIITSSRTRRSTYDVPRPSDQIRTAKHSATLNGVFINVPDDDEQDVLVKERGCFEFAYKA